MSAISYRGHTPKIDIRRFLAPLRDAFTTQSHHAGSFSVPSEAWVRGEPGQQSYVLPWTLATLKDDLHVVGRQGSVTDEFTDQVTTVTISYLDNSEGFDSA
ncbi:hypothetical protein [Halorubrum vacuolatum]|uniref:Uncharacterized protein n=1 Tax=Halorubrum vacuolatum TaxID=63740 RepID=A0A238Y6U4_HALVU|nr:hypothetical protein [Halorubrum vacuolatum]SNR66059.1 hypothetical protein SAMN06264855_13020 [Halorubrum vacuolatum]